MALSPYTKWLAPEAHKRYLDKIHITSDISLFTLMLNQQWKNNNPAAQATSLPPVDASDLVLYLVFAHELCHS